MKLKKITIFIFIVLFASFFSLSCIQSKVFQEKGVYYVEQELTDNWNLIAGISFSDNLHTTSKLNYDAIWKSYYYDAKTRNNVEIRPDYKAGKIDPLLLYSNAFWVFSAKPGKIVYRVSPSFVNKSRLGGYYAFYSGDNLIAINDEMYGKSLEEIKGNCSIIDASYWDANKQDWIGIGLNTKLDFETRDSLTGKGIRIKVKANCGFMLGEGQEVENIRGAYSGFYNFPERFFSESNISKEQVVKVTDAQYLALKDMHNGIKPYNFTKIEYQSDVYGMTTPYGIKLGDSAFPSLNNGNYRWEVMAHEQGHNFFGGTSQFYYQLATPHPFLQESLAVLSAFYSYHFILDNATRFNISQQTRDSLNFDFSNGRNYQNDRYALYVLSGKKFNISDILTSQALDWKMIQYGENYGWGNYKTFTKVFEDNISKKFSFQNDGVSPEEQSTYIIAALGFAFNKDFRADFKELNFPINESFYTTLLDIFNQTSFHQVSNNTKLMSKYSQKEVFLISDKNWRDVLSLVPVTTWTQQEGDDSQCQRGYGTPENVCVYPTLIWHDESEPTEIKVLSSEFKVSFDKPENPWFQFDYFLDKASVKEGESIRLIVQITGLINYPPSDFGFEISKFNPFLILTSESFVLISGRLPAKGQSRNISFEFVFPESSDKSFDIDSSIYFMQQYSPDRVTIIGNTSQELDNLLITAPELGAGLSSSQLQRVSFSDYISYWQNYSEVVYVEDNYELALMASTYASLINAPLIIKNSDLDVLGSFEGRKIICVGNVNRNCNQEYTLEELQQKYVNETQTDKIILVNSEDLNIKVSEKFQPKKSSGSIFEIYGKTSLASPILASAKHEVILSITENDFDNIDKFIKNEMTRLLPGLIGKSREIESLPSFSQNSFLTDGLNSLYFFFSSPNKLKKEDSLIYLHYSGRILSYDLSSKESEYLSTSQYNLWLHNYEVLNGEVFYSLSGADSCSLMSYNPNNKITQQLTSEGSQCVYNGISMDKDNYAFASYNSEGVCSGTEIICSNNENCNGLNACYGTGEACSINEDCPGSFCQWSECKKDLSFFLMNRSNKLKTKIFEESENYISFSKVSDQGVYYIIKSGLIFYNFTDNSKVNILNSISIPVFMDEDVFYYLAFGFSDVSEKYTHSLYSFDLSSKENNLLYSDIESYPYPSVSGDLIFFYPSNSEKVCQRDNSLICREDNNCNFDNGGYGGQCLPTELKSYNRSSGQVSNYASGVFKAPFVYNNTFYYIKDVSNSDNFINGFLTIFGSEKAIPFRKEMGLTGDCDNKLSLDAGVYADFDENYLPDMAVGRIEGITISDVSSYIGRDLFYDTIGPTNNVSFLAGNGIDDHNGAVRGDGISVHNWTNIFRGAGYGTECAVRENYSESCKEYTGENKLAVWQSLMQEKDAFYLAHHGSNSYAGIGSAQIPLIDNSITFSMSCSTCSIEDSTAFCTNLIRKGSLGNLGAVSIAWSGTYTYHNALQEIYLNNLTIGQAYSKSFEANTGAYMTGLIGDPTFKSHVSNKITEELKY